jgi:hypothetical protein
VLDRRILSVLLVSLLTVSAAACSQDGADPKIVANPEVTVSPGDETPKASADPGFKMDPLRQLGTPPADPGKKKQPGSSGKAPADSPALMSFDAGNNDRLITNAYAKWNGGDANARTSPIWEVTSGSLFARNGLSWSGNPDDVEPNADSTNGTGSSIFRMNTKRRDFGNVRVDLRLRNQGLRGDGPDTDGIHVWMHYQDQTKLYVASLNRRDNTIVIKKKLTGGNENGGRYIELAQTAYQVPIGAWQNFSATIRTTGDTVTIAVFKDGRRLLTTTDRGTGGEVITQQGAVGIRADRCEFEFDGFQVKAI